MTTDTATVTRRYRVGDAPLLPFALSEPDEQGNPMDLDLTGWQVELTLAPRERGVPVIAGPCRIVDAGAGLVTFQIGGGILIRQDPSSGTPVPLPPEGFWLPATYDGEIVVQAPAPVGGGTPETLTSSPFVISVVPRR